MGATVITEQPESLQFELRTLFIVALTFAVAFGVNHSKPNYGMFILIFLAIFWSGMGCIFLAKVSDTVLGGTSLLLILLGVLFIMLSVIALGLTCLLLIFDSLSMAH